MSLFCCVILFCSSGAEDSLNSLGHSRTSKGGTVQYNRRKPRIGYFLYIPLLSVVSISLSSVVYCFLAINILLLIETMFNRLPLPPSQNMKTKSIVVNFRLAAYGGHKKAPGFMFSGFPIISYALLFNSSHSVASMLGRLRNTERSSLRNGRLRRCRSRLYEQSYGCFPHG